MRRKEKRSEVCTSLRSGRSLYLELELAAELERARIVGGCYLTEVAIRKSRIDTVPLCVVEGVVGFRAELDVHALGNPEHLEETQIPVEEAGTGDCILTR